MAEIIYVIDAETQTRIQKLETELIEIKALLQKPSEVKPSLTDWIPEPEAIRILRKGKTSLYYLRKSGHLVYSDGKPIFYSLKSIQSFLDNNKK